MAQAKKTLTSNRKANYDYEFVEHYTAGIVLQGNEIKSLRGGHGQIIEAYILIKNDEAWLYNSYIPQYSHSITIEHEYDPYRPRKLLLTRRELKRINELKSKHNLSAIALNIFLSKNNFAKLNFGVGKGRHKYDKREHLKSAAIRHEMEKKSNQ